MRKHSFSSSTTSSAAQGLTRTGQDESQYQGPASKATRIAGNIQSNAVLSEQQIKYIELYSGVLVSQILTQASSLQLPPAVRQAVLAYEQGGGGMHDGQRTLALMRVCYALSANQELRAKLHPDSTLGSKLAELVVRKLETSKLGTLNLGQIIQTWPATTSLVDSALGMRATAWEGFINCTQELAQNPAGQQAYIALCLNHDKGYAQIMESIGEFINFPTTPVVAAAATQTLPELVEAMADVLGSRINTGFGGMSMNGGIIRDMLAAFNGNDPGEDMRNNIWMTIVPKLLAASLPPGGAQDEALFRPYVGALLADNVRLAAICAAVAHYIGFAIQQDELVANLGYYE